MDLNAQTTLYMVFLFVFISGDHLVGNCSLGESLPPSRVLHTLNWVQSM